MNTPARSLNSLRLFFPDTPDIPLPPAHRFPATKYRLLRQHIVAEGIVTDGQLQPSPRASTDDLLQAHDAGYVDSILTGTAAPAVMRRIGLPWSHTLAARSLATVGGTLAAARTALDTGVSGQLAGGTHHAHRDFGSGFCVFNDIAVAALVLLGEDRVRRVAVLDLDVHQGDGNAALLAGRPGLFVVSVHGEKNFPFRKMPSDLDVALADGTGDRDYLDRLVGVLDRVAAFRPELMFYLSGADPLASDTLGRLSLSHEGLLERDRLVLGFAARRGIPVAIAIGGGYADPIRDTVVAYANTFRAAREAFGL